MLEKYEVVSRLKSGERRWSVMYDAESFAHAEEQHKDFQRGDPYADEWEVIRIEKDYATSIP